MLPLYYKEQNLTVKRILFAIPNPKMLEEDKTRYAMEVHTMYIRL